MPIIDAVKRRDCSGVQDATGRPPRSFEAFARDYAPMFSLHGTARCGNLTNRFALLTPEKAIIDFTDNHR